jgi:hypothetical protein
MGKKKSETVAVAAQEPIASPHTTSLIAILNAGNGNCKGISTETNGKIVSFEPLIAPMTLGRGLNSGDEKPTFSLKVGKEIFVFGVDDVFAHGNRDARRRLNAKERYVSRDFFRLLDVLLLHVFASWRGNSTPIQPVVIITVPIEQYNDLEVTEALKEAMLGTRTLADADGCELRIDIKENKFSVQPESTGALMHWAYNPETLQQRPNTSVAGSTLILDTGYDTTNMSLFEGMRYQRNRGSTLRPGGMGFVVQEIADYARKVHRDADESRIDVGMRVLAGLAPGFPKVIDIAPGVPFDVAPAYDPAVEALAMKIADRVRTRYKEAIGRALLVGGGPLHLEQYLSVELPFPTYTVPEPESADLLGLLTALMRKANGLA